MGTQGKKGKRRWHEVTMVVPRLWNEVLPEFLQERGLSGAWVEEEKKAPHKLILHSYLPEEKWTDGLQKEIEGYLDKLDSIFPTGQQKPEVKRRLIEEESWATKWASLFQPFRIGSVWIRPSLKSVQLSLGEQEIVLDPGEAFGTGLHESTQLCLKAILLLRPNLDENAFVLDLGTGSGILAMFAAKSGFRDVLALDIDPAAVETARRNIAVNSLEHFIRVSNEPLSFVKKRFALILANLSATIHQNIAEEIRSVAGGLLAGEGTMLSSLWDATGLERVDQTTQNDWECVILRAG